MQLATGYRARSCAENSRSVACVQTGQTLGRGVSDELVSVVTFEALGLGNRSYLVHDGKAAIVIDPERDSEPYLTKALEVGVPITHVFETHIHNDYVSGGLALARLAGATYVIPAGEDGSLANLAIGLDDTNSIETGDMHVLAIATAGHTPHHLSYSVKAREGIPSAFTGGSLLAGTTGRTDLFGREHAVELAIAQWTSVRKLLEILPNETAIYPTHGFGSFCSASSAEPPAGGFLTVGQERLHNLAAVLDQDEFVHALTDEPLPVPAYYPYIGPLNRVGQPAPDLSPIDVADDDDIAELLEEGTTVVDLRGRRSFAAGHWQGELNIELGVNLTAYLGWVIPFERPFALVAEALRDVDEARRLLSRIGRERVQAWAASEIVTAESSDRTKHYRVASFDDLKAESLENGLPMVVDVRHRNEWLDSHIVGARNLPLPGFAGSIDHLEGDDEPIWVHCEAGFRAAIAASMLSAHGRNAVLIDDIFAGAIAAGLTIEGNSRAHVTGVSGPKPGQS